MIGDQGFGEDLGSIDKLRLIEFLAGITIDAVGFGELAPPACNDNDNSHRINRRVEVWIKSPR